MNYKRINLINEPNAKKIYIDQGDLIASSKPIYTNFVGSCSILGFRINNINFLVHIDGLRNEQYIIKYIKHNFTQKMLHEIQYVYIIAGTWCDNTRCYNSNLSIIKAKIILNEFKIFNKIKIINPVESRIQWKDNITISKKGIQIGDHHIISF